MLTPSDRDRFEHQQLKLEQIYVFLHGVNLKRDLTGTENHVLLLAAEAVGDNVATKEETQGACPYALR
jgi:hypothetical protein